MHISRHANSLIMLLLLTASAHASAEWSKFGSDSESSIYIDAATIEKNAEPASIWILKDYRQEQTGPSREKYRSAKIFYEFKCAERLIRQSYLTRYYGPMGGAGSFPSDARFHPWTAVAPGTEKAKLFEYVCK